jgi:glutamate/tyrosine decarboxylase-like PLP-dependent enzyme
MTLDPPIEEMRRLGYLAVDRAVDHLAALGARRVAARATSAQLQALVREPLPRRGRGAADSQRRFFDELLPTATLVNHPRFVAYIPGPGSFAGALGAWVAAATNLFVGTWLGGGGMAQLELEVLDWLRQALRLPAGFTGILTTGGSMANLGALAAARARAGQPADGVVYTSSEAHYSVMKAARVLGFAERGVRALPADAAQRLPPAAVAAALDADRAAGRAPVCVCATAGTTSTGAIDPLEEIAQVCRARGVWLHVDAAYGGAAALLEDGRELLAGLERADSITLDPHKWLYAPFESGCLLTRHSDALRQAFAADAQYLQDVPRDEVNFFERGPELSRGNRALPLWLLLRSVGLDAIAAAIADDQRRCRLARDLLAADPRIQIVTEPSLSVFTFAPQDGDDAGRALVERILADGHAMLSSTRVGGRLALRFCVANHRTTDDDIHSTITRIRALL